MLDYHGNNTCGFLGYSGLHPKIQLASANFAQIGAASCFRKPETFVIRPTKFVSIGGWGRRETTELLDRVGPAQGGEASEIAVGRVQDAAVFDRQRCQIGVTDQRTA